MKRANVNLRPQLQLGLSCLTAGRQPSEGPHTGVWKGLLNDSTGFDTQSPWLLTMDRTDSNQKTVRIKAKVSGSLDFRGKGFRAHRAELRRTNPP